MIVSVSFRTLYKFSCHISLSLSSYKYICWLFYCSHIKSRKTKQQKKKKHKTHTHIQSLGMNTVPKGLLLHRTFCYNSIIWHHHANLFLSLYSPPQQIIIPFYFQTIYVEKCYPVPCITKCALKGNIVVTGILNPLCFMNKALL